MVNCLRKVSFLLFLCLVIAAAGCHRSIPDPYQQANRVVVDDGEHGLLIKALKDQAKLFRDKAQSNATAKLRLADRSYDYLYLAKVYSDAAHFLVSGPTPDEWTQWLYAKFRFVPLTGTLPEDDSRKFKSASREHLQANNLYRVTSYFVPELTASRVKTVRFKYPLYAVPNDLVKLSPTKIRRRKANGSLSDYYTRHEIDEQNALAEKAKVLAWLEHDIDRYILQVQGSARVSWIDGDYGVIGYAASNGHPFASLERMALADGTLKRDQFSTDNLRSYFIKNPQHLSKYRKRLPRYVFFRIKPDVYGSAGLPVVPLRTIAVDPKRIPLGALIYLRSYQPVLSENEEFLHSKPLALLTVAQDTGSAIKQQHIDLFWGFGPAAASKASRMNMPGELHLLVPR